MRALFFSAGCAVALGVFSSFVTHTPRHADDNFRFTGITVQVLQDTLPRRAAGAKRRVSSQGSASQENQSSDTRGEGTNKGKKLMRKGSVDSTNNGAVNTPDTTKA